MGAEGETLRMLRWKWGSNRSPALILVLLLAAKYLLSDRYLMNVMTCVRRCTTKTLLGLLVLSGSAHAQPGTLLAVAVQNSSAKASPSEAQGPSLDETISFMNSSVAPEESYVTSVNHCEVTILRNRQYRFGIPESTYLKRTDKYGVPHYGFKWAIVEEPQLIRFKFESIDPSTINSKPVPSTTFIKEQDIDQHPSELKNADLMLVSFDAANSQRAIEIGHLPTATDGQHVIPEFDRQRRMGFIVFESKDRAERFVTAFVHAVSLCGGKGSEFAPTPSKP